MSEKLCDSAAGSGLLMPKLDIDLVTPAVQRVIDGGVPVDRIFFRLGRADMLEYVDGFRNQLPGTREFRLHPSRRGELRRRVSYRRELPHRMDMLQDAGVQPRPVPPSNADAGDGLRHQRL